MYIEYDMPHEFSRFFFLYQLELLCFNDISFIILNIAISFSFICIILLTFENNLKKEQGGDLELLSTVVCFLM